MGIADPDFGQLEVERLRARLESVYRELETQGTKYLENLGACADIQGRTTDKLHAAEAVIATLPTPERLEEMAEHLEPSHWLRNINEAKMAGELRAVAAAIREHRNG